jgi:hypothetical protein
VPRLIEIEGKILLIIGCIVDSAGCFRLQY